MQRVGQPCLLTIPACYNRPQNPFYSYTVAQVLRNANMTPANPKILFVTSEAHPLIKTGGLADVSGALPAALHTLGADIKILLPGYPAVLQQSKRASLFAQLPNPFAPGMV